ncbi:transposase [Nakamurella antarctica]|uniref:transposase n=1 Tax=Nakamurella antarctica TaxID=1902245 RepID=UPI00268B977E
MQKPTGSYPSLLVDTTGKDLVSQAGAVVLVATARKVGLDRELSAALRPWKSPWAVIDPGKALLDMAFAVALGGDCLADLAVVRSEPALYGPVASDPTMSRLVSALAVDPGAALIAINTARAKVRTRAWKLAGSTHQTTTLMLGGHW